MNAETIKAALALLYGWQEDPDYPVRERDNWVLRQGADHIPPENANTIVILHSGECNTRVRKTSRWDWDWDLSDRLTIVAWSVMGPGEHYVG